MKNIDKKISATMKIIGEQIHNPLPQKKRPRKVISNTKLKAGYKKLCEIVESYNTYTEVHTRSEYDRWHEKLEEQIKEASAIIGVKASV